MLTLLSKLKLWGAVFVAFVISLMSARYYKKKLEIKQRQLKKIKTLTKNLDKQHDEIKKRTEKQQREISDAIKNDTYLDYFDSDSNK